MEMPQTSDDNLAQFVVANCYAARFSDALERLPEPEMLAFSPMYAGLLSVVYISACEVTRGKILGKDPSESKWNDLKTIKQEAKNNRFADLLEQKIKASPKDIESDYQSLLSWRNLFVHQGREPSQASYEEIRKYCASASEFMRLYNDAAMEARHRRA